jgi:hypothetical protein
MPTYTFTPSSSYDLATHKVFFTSTNLRVILSSTGQLVYNQSYASGIAFQCSGNSFQIGTLTADKEFVKQVDFDYANARLWVEEVNNANRYVGSTDHSDPNIFNIYNLNQCPVRLSKSGNMAQIACPCESTSGSCANGCYKYGA